MDLDMNAGDEVPAEVEGETSVDGLFGSVVGGVFGPAEFAAANDIDAVGEIGGFPGDDFAIDGANGSGFARLAAKAVGAGADVGGDVSALSAGGDGERECGEE